MNMIEKIEKEQAAKDLKNLDSSKKHSEVFKRTLSRLHEMTKIN